MQLHWRHLARVLAAWLLVDLSLMAQGAEPKSDAQPEIVSVEKIWDQAPHHLTTDLIRFKDKWYYSTRESEGHIVGNGKIRIIESTNGKQWASAALLEEAGRDLRDPKLSITPDGRLMMSCGASDYAGTNVKENEHPRIKGLQSRVAFSKDAHQWTKPQQVLGEWDWLWRVTWHNGRAYGILYNVAPPAPDVPVEKLQGWTVRLVTSADGVKWEDITKFDIPSAPSEPTIRFMPDGEMIALVRRDLPNHKGWIGTSKPPYKDWTWKEVAHRVGGPNFIILPNGEMWAGVRIYPGGQKTMLARMTRDSIDPVLTLPSGGGDNSYAGIVWHDGLLWMSYYSSHEEKAKVYLAKIRLPDVSSTPDQVASSTGQRCGRCAPRRSLLRIFSRR